MSEITTKILDNANFSVVALAGKAKLTVTNMKTHKHFTFEICAPRQKENPKKVDLDAKVRFVKVLTGSSNVSSFSFLGFLKRTDNGWIFNHSPKSKIGKDALSFKSFDWIWRNRDSLPTFVEINNEATCAKCRKPLTTNASVKLGLGPKCASDMGF